MWKPILLAVLVIIALVIGIQQSQSTKADAPVTREEPFIVRPFIAELQGRWIGNAVSYGPHRDGQRPGVTSPSAEQMRQDLKLMLPHWNLIRVYSAAEFSEELLSVIHEDQLAMKVMLGVWIALEERRDDSGVVTESFPEAREANQREVKAAIRLAADYPEIVSAISVGNETQIFWSGHRSPLDIHIEHVRQVRANVAVPVTAADDFNYWNKPESRELADEIDFITLHAHPLWNGVQLDGALAWLEEQLHIVQAMHPDRVVVLGETGWATSVHDQGEQAELVKGKPGEAEQTAFYKEVRLWAEKQQLTVFFFEAFDEKWKGGEHPNEVEKHWGLFRADRSPKAAMATSARR